MTIMPGYDLEETHLDPSAYTELFNPRSATRSLSRRPTYTYQNKNWGYIWSLTSVDTDSVPCIEPVTEEDRRRHSFEWMVTHTTDVSIGPLEFCGNSVLQTSISGRVE